jgi:NAD(P)-dependent dehydrogenase (short-subunit alcohol dehydrogenase family)
MLVVPIDVADASSIVALFDTGMASYGRIDLLFVNAGLSSCYLDLPFDTAYAYAYAHVGDSVLLHIPWTMLK